MNIATKIEMVRLKTLKLLKEASTIYNLDFDHLSTEITFDLKGQCAGKAWHRTNKHGWLNDEYMLSWTKIQYNVEAIVKDFDHIYNETIPHEIAHLIIWNERSRTGNQRASHGRQWKAATIKLGGTGKRCHEIELSKARKTRKFKYILESGREHILKTTRHNRLQKGTSGYRTADTGESIKKHHFVCEI